MCAGSVRHCIALVDHVPSVEIILPVRCGAPGRLRQLRTATWPRWRFQKAEAHPPCYRTNNICEHQVHSEQLQQHLRSNKVMVKSVQSQRAPLKLEIPLTTHTHVSYTRCNTGFLFGFGPDTGARALRYTIHSATPHTVSTIQQCCSEARTAVSFGLRIGF